jgi:2'-5' RNA ligase
MHGGEDSSKMHITVIYFGRKSALGDDGIEAIKSIVQAIASSIPVIDGHISGLGRFAATDTSDGKDVIYASIDAPGLSSLRHQLVQACYTAGIPVKSDHDYTPHSTVAYVDQEMDTPPLPPVARLSPVTLDKLILAVNDNIVGEFPLMGVE